MKAHFFAVLIVGSAMLLPGGTLHARDCAIEDPNDSSANVRDTPNGKKVNALKNGHKVQLGEVRNDSQGRPWGYVSGPYKDDRKRDWGWVYMELLRCNQSEYPENADPGTTLQDYRLIRGISDRECSAVCNEDSECQTWGWSEWPEGSENAECNLMK